GDLTNIGKAISAIRSGDTAALLALGTNPIGSAMKTVAAMTGAAQNALGKDPQGIWASFAQRLATTKDGCQDLANATKYMASETSGAAAATEAGGALSLETLGKLSKGISFLTGVLS